MPRCIIIGAITTYLIAVLQTTVGGRLVVAGASPDLLLVWTVCIGLSSGPRAGMLTGFASGALEGALLQSFIGPLAIGKGVGGLGAGIISTKLFRDNWLAPAITAVLITLVNDSIILALAGSRSGWVDALENVGLRALYHAVLTPIAFAAIARARAAICPQEQVT